MTPFPSDADIIYGSPLIDRVWKPAPQTLAADSLPSVCFYSVMNSGVSVSAIQTSDDSSLLAVGLTNSHIKVILMGPSSRLLLDAMKFSFRFGHCSRTSSGV